jgi:hypothetical protein
MEEVQVVGGFRDRGQPSVKRAKEHFVGSGFFHDGNDRTSAAVHPERSAQRILKVADQILRSGTANDVERHHEWTSGRHHRESHRDDAPGLSFLFAMDGGADDEGCHLRAGEYSEQEPENQLQELRWYVQARGWSAVEYVDRGGAGRRIDARARSQWMADPALGSAPQLRAPAVEQAVFHYDIRRW